MCASVSYLFENEKGGRLSGKTPKHEEQLQLFNNPRNEIGKVYFASLKGISEDDLKRWIVTHQISGIVDLRQNPVFSYPRFDHVSLFDFLERQKISFLSGYKIFSKEAHVRLGWKKSRLSSVKDILRALSFGSILVLFGDESQEQEVLSDFRNFFSYASKRQGSLMGAIEHLPVSLATFK